MAVRSFAAIVRNDVEFKRHYQKVKFSKKELALKNLLVAIGERELGSSGTIWNAHAAKRRYKRRELTLLDICYKASKQAHDCL